MTARGWLMLVVAVVVACYFPHLLWGGWVYEDATWLGSVQEPLHLWVSRPRALFRALWLLQASWSPAAAHAVSLGLHLAVAALAGVLVRRLGLSPRAAVIGVIVVLVPALGVETVAYAAQQGELIAALGVLGACVLAAGRWWRAPVWLGMLLSLGVGFLGKESAVVGFALVPAVIAVSAPRWHARPLWAVTVLPVVLAAVCAFGGVMFLGGWSSVMTIGESVDAKADALPWILVQSTAAVRMLGLLLVPGGPFTVDYDYDLVPMVQRWLSACGLGMLCLMAWWLRRPAPLVALGLAWLLVVIAPRLIIQTPRSYFNEHQAYLLLPGFALLVGAAWDGSRRVRL